MSFTKLIKDLELGSALVAYRPSQNYTVAVATYTLFNIRDGAVLIAALGCRETVVATGATTLRLTVNGVNVDAAAVAINAAVGAVGVSCLNVAGTFVNAAAVPLTDALLNSKGIIAGTQPAGPGLIVGVFGIGTDWTGEFFVVYRRLSPNARITL